ncbi:Putative amidoligase enzyme [Curtobacterium sp. 9128]|uniref:amidoligase family protein n=1 Tax=Curtobacterium sp. 9128 TaxID=1793722 RepID=UPI0007D72FEA|nr:amidoligase family protein [Curtobacterium sp. 9128]SBN64654.1 Putative amidoligase enzyme [Curtobacterium sp. 9128]
MPAPDALTTRTGFEIELLAPVGSSRRALAERIADEHGGSVLRVFHVDSEPSLVPGMGQFWHLTPGYRIDDATGTELATLVDDITIVEDIRRDQLAARCGETGHQGCPLCRPDPDPDAFRILSDDLRLLRLAGDTTGAQTRFEHVLDGIARVFDVPVETVGAVRRVRDRAGASIAMATAVAPGRERPCEIVTPPIRSGHTEALEALLGPARALGFRVPVEAAVHLHLDAGPFRSVPAFANVVRLFTGYRSGMHAALGTNPHCVRTGALPEALTTVVDTESRSGADWPRLQEAVRTLGLTKYLDVNLTALLTDTPPRDTIEVRILPGMLDGADITGRAAIVEALLERCLDPTPLPQPPRGVPSEEALLVLLADARARQLQRIRPALA